jgi:antitoxin component of MazEF toxin-antitoxin module
MKQKIRKIGNSRGIIIPRLLLQEIGMPEVVDIRITGDGFGTIFP